MSPTKARKGRTTAEMVTFVIACSLLLAVVGLIAQRLGDETAPAHPVASVVGAPRPQGDQYEVHVEVSNDGNETAANLHVRAALTIDGETGEVDQEIAFLAGDETEDLWFVFDDDPRSGELVVGVTGYATP